MFSKEESKKLRQEFWTSFGKSYPRKWILYNTKVKGLVLKFSFDVRQASVSIDVEADDLMRRIELWEKLVSLRSILINDYNKHVIFNDSFVLSNQKEISRIYIEKLEVSIHNKNTWQETMIFLNTSMKQFEAFFIEYKDILN